MPKIQKLTETLKKEEALSLKLANKVEFLTGELDKARRKLASEISENEFLKRVIEEWKKMASGLMAQLVTRNTELSIAEEANEIMKKNTKETE